MKLSEAIRMGCYESRPLTGHYIDFQKHRFCACALGAAFLAISERHTKDRVEEVAFQMGDRQVADKMVEEELEKEFGSLFDSTRIPFPQKAGGEVVMGLRQGVICLNDDLLWTREKIADFLKERGL